MGTRTPEVSLPVVTTVNLSLLLFIIYRNISKRLVGRQTNVRAEIMAAIVAIETAKELGNI